MSPLSGEGIDPARKKKGQEDVFLNGEGWEEVEKLKHESNFKASKGGEFGVIQGVERVTLEVGLASRWGVESSEDVEKGAFTASAGSGDRHNLPRKDFQGNPP